MKYIIKGLIILSRYISMQAAESSVNLQTYSQIKSFVVLKIISCPLSVTWTLQNGENIHRELGPGNHIR